MGKCILECMLKDPCPARSSADRDVCTKEEGACEYQVLGIVDEDLKEEKVKTIRKKIHPEFFKSVRTREKNFELRIDEDDVQVGDLLILEEWDGFYTGENVRRYVKYVLRDVPGLGLMDGYCIIGW